MNIKTSQANNISIVFRMAILFSFLLSTSVLATIRGEGRFRSQRGDSTAFIKNQLKYQAFKDVITRELYSMNLEPQTFWQNHYNKFESSFQSVRRKLKENFEQKKLSAKEYQDALRIQKLSAMARFGNLNRLIKSYSEKSYTRAPNAPHIRYLEIDATLDRRALARLYFKTTLSKQESQYYQRIYLSTEFQLQGKNWNALGVNKKSDLTETLEFHWKKWFEKNYPNMKEVVRVDAVVWEYLKNHLRSPHFEAQAGHYVNSNAPPPGRFQNGLWVLIKIHLKKMERMALSKKQTFHVQGNLVMIDLNTRKIVSHKDFFPVKQAYHFSTPHKLSSSLATLIWKLPLETFRLKSARTNFEIKRIGLVIREIGSIQELLQVKELLINRGLGMGFNPLIATYSGSYGVIELAYRGASDKALAIIKSIDGVGLKQEKKLVAQNPFSFAIKPL